ncbi:MAG: hypothetical protein AVDCRST_MAG86-2676 [uncultured Truepera sp.]|uniref:Uncharacterized protein n=1 Tax=uncultured Truepera sp. TaxID=543023 RepID=A0A6J4VJW1_9DEIN|nr:MAG: hypothetical protein AVDCRST_MAG86-2676 [uncultured Truepera sp.]
MGEHYAQVHPDVLNFYITDYSSDAPLETSLAQFAEAR